MKKLLLISALLLCSSGFADSTVLVCEESQRNRGKNFSIEDLLGDKIDFSKENMKKMKKKDYDNRGSSSWPTPIANKIDFSIIEINPDALICVTYLNDNHEITPECSSWEITDYEYKKKVCDSDSRLYKTVPSCLEGVYGPRRIDRSIDRKTLVYEEDVYMFSVADLYKGIRKTHKKWRSKYSCKISDKTTANLMESKFKIAQKPFVDYMNSYLDKKEKEKQEELDKNKI